MTIPASNYNGDLVTPTAVNGVHIVQQQHLFDVHTDREGARAPEADTWIASGFGFVKPEVADVVVVVGGANAADAQAQLDSLRQIALATTSVRLYREDGSALAFERPVWGLSRFYTESPVGPFGYRVRMGFRMKPPRTMGWLVDASGVRLVDANSEVVAWAEEW